MKYSLFSLFKVICIFIFKGNVTISILNEHVGNQQQQILKFSEVAFGSKLKNVFLGE